MPVGLGYLHQRHIELRHVAARLWVVIGIHLDLSQRGAAANTGLRRLLQANPATVLSDVVDPESVSVLVGTDQEEVARIMSRYDLVSLPVVDAQGLLVGVITIDDVLDVLEEETTEDFQRLGASEPLDRPYLDTSVFTIFRKRIGWLL